MTQVLYIKGYGQQAYDGFSAAVLWYQCGEVFNTPTSTAIEVEIVTGTEDPTHLPFGQFNSIANALDYYASTKCSGLLSTVNATYGSTYYTSYVMQKMDHPVQAEFDSLANVARSGSYTDLSGTPTFSVVATTGAYSDLSGKPTIPSAQVSSDWNAVSGVSQILNKPTIPSVVIPTFTTPSRIIGTAFQISTTQRAEVVYSIPVTSNATLLVGSQVSATFQYADNSAMTTNPVTLPGDAFGVASGLLVSGIGSLKLVGTIPIGKWVKITSTNLAGTPTLGAVSAQEVLI